MLAVTLRISTCSLVCLLLASCFDPGSITSQEDVDAASGDGDGDGDGDVDGDGDTPDSGFTAPVDGEPAQLMGITNAHNVVRAAHGVAAIAWDNELAAVAAAWANNCEWGHNAGRSDNYPGYVGENIYGASFVPTGLAVTESWASEEANYNYANNTCSGVCEHYTQVVWANSTKLGCAIANCPNIPTPNFVVCNYAPGGNFNGERPY